MDSLKIEAADHEALRANKLVLVERLADDLAHEIKNPLHSMVINLEVLKRRVSRWSGADATELLRYVGILSGELDRVSRRVELLLRMVRPDRAGEPISLAQAVEDLLEVVELERERQAVSIRVHPPALAVPGRVQRDVARQIVLNLLLISIDAAGQRGSVDVTTRTDGDEESLRLVALPDPGRDRTGATGVQDDRTMRETVRVLVDSLGGRLETGRSPDHPGASFEIVVGIPLNQSQT